MQMSELQAKSNNNLALCPFCGGEADVTLCQSAYGQSYRIHHEHASPCPAAYVNGLQFRTEAEAIAAWNSRAERTCKQSRFFNLIKRECDGKHYSWRGDEMPNYCPNCGARIVGRDDE